MSLNQKDALYKAVSAHKQPDGSFDRKTVVEELMAMYTRGEFEHSKPEKVSDEKSLRNYCGSMVSNWLRKDDRLGGTEPAVARVGRKRAKAVDDEMLRLMKAKVVLTTEGQSTQEIDSLIAQRSLQIESFEADVRSQSEADAEAILAFAAQTQ